MKLIIDISDEDYDFIKDLRYVALARGNTKTIQKHIIDAIKQGEIYEGKQGECEKCDYRKIAEIFVDKTVDFMNKNGITNFEQLQEMLRGKEE